MKNANDNKNKWIHLRVTSNEYVLIKGKFNKTTCRNLSEYTRKVLLDQSIVTTYRNTSQDDLLETMAVLTRELNAIGNNINQSAKRLHTLQQHEASSWAAQYSLVSASLEGKIAEAKTLLNAIAERWLR